MEVLVIAFLIGLGGSLHCVGMCGPLQLAFHGNQQLNFQGFSRQLLYHSGRITTYAVFGGITGLLGQTIKIAGFQQGLSISIGVLIGLGALGMIGHSFTAMKWPFMDKVLLKLKMKMGSLLHRGKDTSRFALGMLNGFLPCGFVYMAMAGALALGDVGLSTGFMAIFGLGTLPAMMGVSLLGYQLPRQKLIRWRPLLQRISLVIIALLIVRGLNLGIPYLSPEANEAGIVQCE